LAGFVLVKAVACIAALMALMMMRFGKGLARHNLPARMLLLSYQL